MTKETLDVKRLRHLLDMHVRQTPAGEAAWAELESRGPELAQACITKDEVIAELREALLAVIAAELSGSGAKMAKARHAARAALTRSEAHNG